MVGLTLSVGLSAMICSCLADLNIIQSPLMLCLVVFVEMDFARVDRKDRIWAAVMLAMSSLAFGPRNSDNLLTVFL